MTLDWGTWLGEDWGLGQVEGLREGVWSGAGGPVEEQGLAKESWEERFLRVLKGRCCWIFQTATGHFYLT